MSYYLVRVGEGSKYIDEARRGEFIAVGWNEVPNLKKLGTSEGIKDALAKTSYQYTTAQIGAQAGQLYRFGLEMQIGDTVISPLGAGEYLIGEVGEYYFEDRPLGHCDYKHRRTMCWTDKIILKEDMSTNLAYALGATLTIFSLEKYADELDSLISGKPITPAEKPEHVRDIILTGLMDLDGKEFEEFVTHLLDIVGFTAETTQYVGDKGIDVNGMLDAEGLASITLRVQVKRSRASIGNKDVLALRGALSQGEHGCLITLSTFTSQAIEEAQAPGKIYIKLIDGNDLSGLILRHFDDIDDNYKGKLGIRRKKDFNLEDQFEAATETIALPEKMVEADVSPEWDTLVCAAKEDGFKRAFLEQRAWWAVRLNPKTLLFIKYVAIYQVAPVSQITFYGKVKTIEPFENTGKYILHLDGEPIKLEKPVGLGRNRHLKPQGPKYAYLEDIMKARSLDDVFGAV